MNLKRLWLWLWLWRWLWQWLWRWLWQWLWLRIRRDFVAPIFYFGSENNLHRNSDTNHSHCCVNFFYVCRWNAFLNKGEKMNLTCQHCCQNDLENVDNVEKFIQLFEKGDPILRAKDIPTLIEIIEKQHRLIKICAGLNLVGAMRVKEDVERLIKGIL
jgi:hypothetical protein